MGDKKEIVISVLLVTTIILALTTTSWFAVAKQLLQPEPAFGQTTPSSSSSAPRDIRVIDSAGLLEQIIRDIQNMRLIDYDLYQNGTANYTFQPAAGVNRTLEVKTTHTYTPDNGYIYNSSGIFTHNGQQQIIIETFPPRMGPSS